MTQQAEQAYLYDRAMQWKQHITDYNRFHKWLAIRLREDEEQDNNLFHNLPTVCKFPIDINVRDPYRRTTTQQIKNWLREWVYL